MIPMRFEVREVDRNGTTRLEVHVAQPDMGKINWEAGPHGAGAALAGLCGRLETA
jgi:hypothetical protein